MTIAWARCSRRHPPGPRRPRPIARFAASAAGVVAAALAGSAPSLAQDKLRLAIGGRGAWENAVSEIARTRGIFKKHGLDVEILWTEGTGETMQAAISGSVDLAVAVGTNGVLAAFTKGVPIRVIGSTMTGVDDMFWYAKAGSPIKSGKDMAGRTVAFSSRGASTHAVVLGFRKTFGIDFKEIPLGSPVATMTQAMTGQVEVGWTVVPLGLKELDEGSIQMVARANEVAELRNQSVRLIVVMDKVLAARRDALVRYLRAYREGVDYLYGPDGVKAYAAYSGVAEKHAATVRDTFTAKASIQPDRFEGLDLMMADAVAFKFMSAPLTPAQIKELVAMPLDR